MHSSYNEVCSACWMHDWFNIDNWFSTRKGGRAYFPTVHVFKQELGSTSLNYLQTEKNVQVETWFKSSDLYWRNPFHSSPHTVVFLVSFGSCQVDCGIFPLLTEIPGPFQVCCSLKVRCRSSYPKSIYRKLQLLICSTD